MSELKNLDIQILNQFTVQNEKEIEKELKDEIEKNHKKIIVLDDDPTGVQTVHDVSVYTDWSEESIRSGFEEKTRMFYILTNSRGFTIEQTTLCHKEIIERIDKISKKTGKEYLIISRGDSTLRGHYPLETELLREGFEADGTKRVDGEIICPFFKEGGRYTIENIHYVKTGNQLIPAGQTEFAKDKTFGYQSSVCVSILKKKQKDSIRRRVSHISL